MNEISDLSDIISWDIKDNNSIFPNYCFRGENANFGATKLTPSLLRLKGMDKQLEEKLFDGFCRKAYHLLPKELQHDIQKLAIAQHYGLPTRLLDWTSNPLIALYFCVDNADDTTSSDAYLYALPIELSKMKSIPDIKFSTSSLQDIQQEDYFLKSQKRSFSLFQLSDICGRIRSQSGMFSIHSLDYKSTDLHNTDTSLVTFKIPAKNKQKIASQLNALDINRASVYLELEDIANAIKKAAKKEIDSQLNALSDI
jgi:hypothetical protein